MREVFNWQTVWNSEVEVYNLCGHPKVNHAWAWSHSEGRNNEGERSVAVLEIPPVVSPVTAVCAYIVADARKKEYVRQRIQKPARFALALKGVRFLSMFVSPRALEIRKISLAQPRHAIYIARSF